MTPAFLARAVGAGDLNASECMVWREGQAEWMPIDQAPGLLQEMTRSKRRPLPRHRRWPRRRRFHSRRRQQRT